MTLEAQNALLKLFEDPKENTHFFLITPHPEKLLKTLTSRLFILGEGQPAVADNDASKEATVFLASSGGERLLALKDIITKKDKTKAKELLDALEVLLYSKLEKGKDKRQIAHSLHEIEVVRGYLFDRSSSLKLLLEHVAITVPKM